MYCDIRSKSFDSPCGLNRDSLLTTAIHVFIFILCKLLWILKASGAVLYLSGSWRTALQSPDTCAFLVSLNSRLIEQCEMACCYMLLASSVFLCEIYDLWCYKHTGLMILATVCGRSKHNVPVALCPASGGAVQSFNKGRRCPAAAHNSWHPRVRGCCRQQQLVRIITTAALIIFLIRASLHQWVLLGFCWDLFLIGGFDSYFAAGSQSSTT